jgi:hypothetical protein
LKAVWKSREQEEEERKQRLEEANRQLDPTANNPSGTFTPKFPEKWVKMRNPERLQPLMQLPPPPGSKFRGRLWEYNPNDYSSNYEILRLNLKPCWPQFLLWSLDENETERITEEKRRDAAESAAKSAEKLNSSSKKRKRVEEQFDLSDLPMEASRAVLKQKAAAAASAGHVAAVSQHQDLSQDEDGGFEIDFSSDRGVDSSSSEDEADADAHGSLQDLSALLAPENIPENDPIRKEFVKEKKKVLGIISAMFSDDDSQDETAPPAKKRRLSASSSSSDSSSSESEASDAEQPALQTVASKSSSASSAASSASSASSKSSSRSTSSGSESSSSEDDAMAVDQVEAAEQEDSSSESESSSSSSSSSSSKSAAKQESNIKSKGADSAKVPDFSIERQDIGGAI